MPKCPKCNQEIDSLQYNTTLEEGGIAFILGDSEYSELGYHERFTDAYGTTFYCPECNKLLFDGDDDALEFLLGGKEFVTVSEKEPVLDLLDAICTVVGPIPEEV